MTDTTALDRDSVRRGFQVIYASWAGTLIVRGLSDDIVPILESTQPGFESVPEAKEVAARARAIVIHNLGQLRESLRP